MYILSNLILIQICVYIEYGRILFGIYYKLIPEMYIQNVLGLFFNYTIIKMKNEYSN
jgi:hypothetical protein